MMKRDEIWKPVIDYEGIYEVSNLGRIRKILKHGFKIRVLRIKKTGYVRVNLSKCRRVKTKLVHQLVAESFLNHVPCGHKLVVNHKDFNRSNNVLTNLELITQRENANLKHLKSSSKYTGVCLDKNSGKWKSQIKVKGLKKHLGSFENEIDAHNAYQEALKNLTNEV